MREIAAAGVGTVITSWWGRGSREDRRLPQVIEAARANGLAVAAHLEPYGGRTVASTEADIRQPPRARDHRLLRLGLGLLPDAEWAALNEQLDGVRHVREHEPPRQGRGRQVRRALHLRRPALRRRALPSAVPSGAPARPAVRTVGRPRLRRRRATGDTRVRPRRDGATYDSMWRGAVQARADLVTITSYNEWHEGTQIEPARGGRLRLRELRRRLGSPRARRRERLPRPDRDWVRALGRARVLDVVEIAAFGALGSDSRASPRHPSRCGLSRVAELGPGGRRCRSARGPRRPSRRQLLPRRRRLDPHVGALAPAADRRRPPPPAEPERQCRPRRPPGAFHRLPGAGGAVSGAPARVGRNRRAERARRPADAVRLVGRLPGRRGLEAVGSRRARAVRRRPADRVRRAQERDRHDGRGRARVDARAGSLAARPPPETDPGDRVGRRHDARARPAGAGRGASGRVRGPTSSMRTTSPAAASWRSRSSRRFATSLRRHRCGSASSATRRRRPTAAFRVSRSRLRARKPHRRTTSSSVSERSRGSGCLRRGSGSSTTSHPTPFRNPTCTAGSRNITSVSFARTARRSRRRPRCADSSPAGSRRGSTEASKRLRSRRTEPPCPRSGARQASCDSFATRRWRDPAPRPLGSPAAPAEAGRSSSPRSRLRCRAGARSCRRGFAAPRRRFASRSSGSIPRAVRWGRGGRRCGQGLAGAELRSSPGRRREPRSRGSSSVRTSCKAPSGSTTSPSRWR